MTFLLKVYEYYINNLKHLQPLTDKLTASKKDP